MKKKKIESDKLEFNNDTYINEKALTILLENSGNLLESDNVNEFFKRILNLLSDNLFGYKNLMIFQYNKKLDLWELFKSKKNNILDKSEVFNNITDNFKEPVQLKENKLFMLCSYSETMYVLLVEKKKKELFNDEELSFFKLLRNIFEAFYKILNTTGKLHNKIVEISSIKVSNEIMNDLREGKTHLKEACLKLYQSLSMEGVILFIPTSNDKYIVEAKMGIKIRSWDKYMDFVGSNDPESLEWQTFYLIDSRYNIFGIVGFKMSRKDEVTYNIQQDVLDSIIPQMISILSERKSYLQANTDVLTGLYNRRYIDLELNGLMNVLKKNKRFKLTVLMMDIDHFKKVNDTYGHEAGDIVLKSIATSIKDSLRDIDIVGRYGGEEFVAIIQGDVEIAVSIAERIRKRIKKTDIKYVNDIINTTISIGLSEFTRSMDVEDVLLFADSMLYKAKDSGRDKIVG